jgi:hypothetical protein
MKRIIKLCLLVVFAMVMVRATCGTTKPAFKKPTQEMKITDNVYFHNVGITNDGRHFYTINGGNDAYCTLNEYDKKGDFIDYYDVELDGRAIFYNPIDDELYIKNYGLDLYLVDLWNEMAHVELADIFEEENSSPAMSPDGKFIYEYFDGKVRVIDFETGNEIDKFKLSKWYDEHGYNYAIAASSHHLFVWSDEFEIAVYDLDGTYVTELELPRTGFGFSLSWCKDMLWIARDADASSDGGDGYWYAYKLF